MDISVRSRHEPPSTDTLFKIVEADGVNVPLLMIVIFPIPLTDVLFVILQPLILSVVFALPVMYGIFWISSAVVPVTEIVDSELSSVDTFPRT